MIKSILDNRKTQTRRVVKRGTVGRMMHGDQKLWPYECDPRAGADCASRAVPCPYGQPGDRLWVRETWQTSAIAARGLCYRADYDAEISDYARWRPSIHMPRWASRITLEVEAVRVERVADITEADAIAEGAAKLPKQYDGCYWTHGADKNAYRDVRLSFATLWDSINAARGYGWAVNPWVWVVTFRKA